MNLDLLTEHGREGIYRHNALTSVTELIGSFLQKDPEAGRMLRRAKTYLKRLEETPDTDRWKGILVPASELERAVEFLENQNGTVLKHMEAVLGSFGSFNFASKNFLMPAEEKAIENKIDIYLAQGLLDEALRLYEKEIETRGWKTIKTVIERTSKMPGYAAPSEFRLMKEARQLAKDAGELCEIHGYHEYALRFYEQSIYLQTLMKDLDPDQKCKKFSVKLLESAQRAARRATQNREVRIKKGVYTSLAILEGERSFWSKLRLGFDRTDLKQSFYSALGYQLHSNPFTY